MNTHDHSNPPARLSDTERADMRRDFAAFMQAHPASESAAGPVRSPYAAFLRYQPFAYVLLLFVLLGGTAYAAEGSLPQDLLYPVKIQVLEPLAVQAASLLGVSQGETQSALVERRLEEAEQLVSEGTLNGETAAFLSDKIDDSSGKVQEYASAAAHDGRLDDALDANSKLETILEAHGQVLASVADDRATTTADVEQFVYDIQAKGDEAQTASEKTEDGLGAATTSDAVRYVGELQDTASTTIGELAAALAAPAPEGDLSDGAAALFAQAQQYYAAGAAQFAAKDFDGALSSFRDAQSAAEKGSILLSSDADLTPPEDSPEEDPSEE